MRRKDDSIMPFDVDAWIADPAVKLLRPASRAFWFECLLLMWKRGRTGELKEELTALSKLACVSPAEARSAILEIKERNVGDADISEFAQCNTNVTLNVTLVNRRMKRDFERRISVAKRVGKHRLMKYVTQGCNADVTLDVTRMKQPMVSPPMVSPPITPSSLSPSSLGVGAEPEAENQERLAWLLEQLGEDSFVWQGLPTFAHDSIEFRVLLAEWLVSRKQSAKGLKQINVRHRMAELNKMGLARSCAAIRYSLANGYDGIVEPKPGDAKRNGNSDNHSTPKSGYRLD